MTSPMSAQEANSVIDSDQLGEGSQCNFTWGDTTPRFKPLSRISLKIINLDNIKETLFITMHPFAWTVINKYL